MKIALTGGIGTGKSTVSKILKRMGYPIVDTDVISKEIVDYPEVLKKLVEVFGEEIILNKKLNRSKLGQIVFKNKKKLEELNSIMHPVILKKMWEEIEKLEEKNKYVFADIPLLFEINLENKFDKVLLIYSNRDIQVNRVMLRDGRTKDEALNIINSQIDIEIKKEKSDYVIINETTIEELEKNVYKILEKIEKSEK